MKTINLISKIKAMKRVVIVFFILVSCGLGIYGNANDIARLLKNEEINASLKMNQIYQYFLPKKKELQFLLSGNKKAGFFTDVLMPQDREVVFYTFGYLLAPIILDKNYLSNNTIITFYFFPQTLDWLEKKYKLSVIFQENYDFCKLAILKKRK